VIYPQEIRKIAKLWHEGRNIGPDGQRYQVFYAPEKKYSRWDFRAASFQCEISCEGTPTVTVEKLIPELSVNWP